MRQAQCQTLCQAYAHEGTAPATVPQLGDSLPTSGDVPSPENKMTEEPKKPATMVQDLDKPTTPAPTGKEALDGKPK